MSQLYHSYLVIFFLYKSPCRMFPFHKLTNCLTWSISLGDERLNSKFTVPWPVKQAWGAGTDRTHPPSLINSVHVRWIKLTHKSLYDNFISNTCPMYILTDQANSSGTTVELESLCILWFHQNSFNISFPGFLLLTWSTKLNVDWSAISKNILYC